MIWALVSSLIDALLRKVVKLVDNELDNPAAILQVPRDAGQHGIFAVTKAVRCNYKQFIDLGIRGEMPRNRVFWGRLVQKRGFLSQNQ